ncbi:hypothetical protein HPB50_015732 [Hyalomma asiaticum]|uniref:Uncharacterized protein n=1 Tax=Hyalomma asiaticum TaxID=266040 RepID=A0ACB7SWW0_HYAAI|nr:hypothetical protein HPB50_015732 [Hyalomma asiaticum]
MRNLFPFLLESVPKFISLVYRKTRVRCTTELVATPQPELAEQYGTDPDTRMQPTAARMGSCCWLARTSSPNTAEALAVALAIKTTESMTQGSYILTDSQIACRYFTSGSVPACVARLLGATLDQEHSFIWCPAHVEATGNDRADGAARALTRRATVPRPVTPVCNSRRPCTLPGISQNTSVDKDGAIQHHSLG